MNTWPQLSRFRYQSFVIFSVLLAGTAASAAGQQSSDSTPGAAPASAAAPPQSSYTIQVDGTKEWTDTMLDVRGGEKLKITAEGTITYTDKKKTFGPTGIPRGFADLIHEYAVPDGTHGELIGRLGSGDTGQAFEVGASLTYTAPVAERLFLGVNQSMKDAAEATGSFQVTIEVLEQGSTTTVGGPGESTIPGITKELLASLPRRVGDEKHLPGDMVNILLIGNEDDVVKVFTTAGWVKVDKSVGGTIKEGLLDTFEKKDYLTMPMSTLYLFDRSQDYGFAHAEPVRVVMSRNHLRVWKSPYQVKGRPLWCIAATHDIGFERDQRNNGLTHKIDPAIDGEREYVNQTLSATGLVVARGHVTPADALTTAKTATGGEFHSDGRILVLALKSEE
ncbi:MAG TPA: LssY C-terminal domain-containing protein [Candidatus Sulfotelmatobacter sp.]|nr:LssY C-terminal domain-containing protein [Candidatus Sulfotelmatobacter sp.]